MQILRCLIGATILAHYVYGAEELKGCLPVEDGKPYRLACPYIDSGFPVTWTIKSPKGSTQYNSKDCVENNSSNCSSQWRDRIVINNGSVAGRSSVVNITRVTVQDHGAEIACVVGRQGNKDKVLTCQLQVYHKPESPICDVNKTGDNIVHIWCTTSKVFPGLVCNFAQFESKTKQMLSLDTGHVKSVDQRTDDVYLTSTCSWTVYSLEPGTYQYFPVLQPKVTKNVSGTSVPVSPMKQVHIPSIKQQLIIHKDNLHPFSDNCQLEIPKAVYVCEARGFSRQPTLELLVDRNQAEPLTTIVTETSEGSVYRTVFKLNDPTDYPNANVICLANTQDQYISQEFRLGEHDAFQQTSELFLNSDVVHRLSCHARNRSDVSKLQISCFRGKELLFTTNAQGNAAEITLQLGYESATCVCLNADERKCFSHETYIRVSDATKEEGYDMLMTVIIIVSVCLCLTLLAFILVLTCTLKRKQFKKGKRKVFHTDVEDFQEIDLMNGKK